MEAKILKPPRTYNLSDLRPKKSKLQAAATISDLNNAKALLQNQMAGATKSPHMTKFT